MEREIKPFLSCYSYLQPEKIYLLQLYDWLQEHEKRVLNMFHQFDQEDKEGKFKGKLTQENFVVCLQTLSKNICMK